MASPQSQFQRGRKRSNTRYNASGVPNGQENPLVRDIIGPIFGANSDHAIRLEVNLCQFFDAAQFVRNEIISSNAIHQCCRRARVRSRAIDSMHASYQMVALAGARLIARSRRRAAKAFVANNWRKQNCDFKKRAFLIGLPDGPNCETDTEEERRRQKPGRFLL